MMTEGSNIDKEMHSDEDDVELCYPDTTTKAVDQSATTVSTLEDEQTKESEPTTLGDVPVVALGDGDCESLMLDDEETGKSSSFFRGRRLGLAIGCGACILVVGIVALVLGVQGFFAFKEPCIAIHSFVIDDMNLDYSGDMSNRSGALLGMLDQLTSGKASMFLPSGANLTVQMIMEVNNTNPYDLDYHQNEDGTIAIPASDTSSSGGELSIPPEHEDDMVVGTWSIPGSTLKKKARNEIPVTVTVTLDMATDDSLGDLAPIFLSGGELVLRVKGAIAGSSWVPGLTGTTDLVCVAQVDDIKAQDKEAKVKCRKSTRIGGLINDEEDMAFEGSPDMMEEAVDPVCIV